jgi:hypothetical protein
MKFKHKIFMVFDLHFANTAEETVRQEHTPNLNLFCIGTNNVGIGMCTGDPQIPGVSPPCRPHFYDGEENVWILGMELTSCLHSGI